MKPNTKYLIIWNIGNETRWGYYTWDGKGISTSVGDFIVLTRVSDGTKSNPVKVDTLVDNVYSVVGKTLDLTTKVKVK